MTTDPLADAVDRLAKPTTIQTITRNDQGIRCEGEYVRDSLIKQLRDGIMTGRESGGGAASFDFRIPFDDVALSLYNEIKATVSKWWRDLTGKPERLDPAETLRQWHLAVILHRGSSVLDAFKEAFYVVQLDTWADAIDAHFNPPRLIEVTHACPTCGVRWTAATDGNQIAALVITWPRGEDTTLADAKAKCRACGQEWEGERVRFLSHEIDVSKRPSSIEAHTVGAALSVV